MFKSKLFYVVSILVVAAAIFFYKYYRSEKLNNEVAYFMQTTSAPSLPLNNALKKPPSPVPPASTTKNTPPAVLPKLFGVMMIISGIPNSQEMVNGIVCLENAPNLDKVDLYMPDMGHGSEPPKVTAVHTPDELLKYQKEVPHFGCYLVESMQLFMPGTWQVRIFYKNGATGLFTIDLKK